AKDRRRPRTGRAERRHHGVVSTQDGSELVGAARVASPHVNAIAGWAELLRRAHEGGQLVASLSRLLDQRQARAAGGPNQEQPHAVDPSLRAAAVRAREDLEQMAVWILEVHAAPAIAPVDLAGAALAGVGPVLEPPLANPAEDLVEIVLADQEGVV